jgi:hypothetical protein
MFGLYGAPMRRLLTALALLSITACSGGNDPVVATPAPATAAPVVTTSSAAPADQNGDLACVTLSKAMPDDDVQPLIDQPGTVDLIVKAAADSVNPAIKQAGEPLAERAGRAAALAGTEQEDDTLTALTGAADRLKQACVAAGLGYW